MGNSTSSEDISHDLLQDPAQEDQRRLLREFYDHLEDQFGDDLPSAFTTSFSDLPDLNSIPDPDQRATLCESALSLEPRLAELRYRLVPSRISEQHFWTHFLIKLDDFRSHYDVDMTPDKEQCEVSQKRSISLESDSIQQTTRISIAPIPNDANAVSAAGASSALARAEVLPRMEVSLLNIPEVYVYQIPPRRDAQGHYAQSWGLDKPLWSGALRVISLENFVIFLRLYDPNSGHVFADSDVINLEAVCEQSEPNRSARLRAIQIYVEPTLDTSRYFVVKFKNSVSGQIVYLGIGFRHRSSAFDLNASILDQLSKCERYLNLDTQTGAGGASNNLFTKDDEQTKENHTFDLNMIGLRRSLSPNQYQLPSLPGSDEDTVPPALSPPKPQTFLPETDDEDDDSFGSFLAAGQPSNKI